MNRRSSVRKLRGLTIFLLCLVLAQSLKAADPRAEAAKRSFLSLSEVKPGLRGVGKTVFHGDKVEEFQVEVLGVLENIAPK